MPRLSLVSAGLLCLVLVPAGLAQEQAEPICPLTKEQSQKSVDAFEKLYKFFTTEPRCVNCHGAVNPYIDGTGSDPEDGNAPPSTVEHGGGKQDHEKDSAGAFLTDVGCMECHNHMAPRTNGSPSVWMTAPNFLSFVGKDAPTLCKQIKNASTKGAKEFLGHMTDDNGGNNFTGTSYNGDRGLDRERFTEAEVPTQKPSISHAQLMTMAHDWVDAMGGRFRGGLACGCEKQEYALQVDYKINLNLNFGPLTGQYATSAGANSNGVEIPLEIGESGEVTGQGMMTLGGNGYVAMPGVGCTGQSQQQYQIRANAQLQEGDEQARGQDERLHAQLDCSKVQLQSSAQCAYAGGSQNTTNQCAMAVTMDFVPATVSASQTYIYPMPTPNSQATLTTTIIKK